MSHHSVGDDRGASTLRFDGRVAVVTGAGRGLGRAYALDLAARGAAVVVNDLGVSRGGRGEDLGPAEQVAAEIVEAGGRAVASGHDITDPDGAAEIVELALRQFGAVDIVVNNAGFQRDEAFADQDDETFRSIVAAHLFGSVNVTRQAWRHMIRAGYGRVVMTTSAIGFWGAPGSTAYAAAKAGVAGLARSLAIEGAAHGIKVNSVAPAAETRMSADRFSKPGSRTWRPELVVPAVTYLSHESCAVNGAIVSAFSGLFAGVEVVQYRGYRFDPRGEVTAEDFAVELDGIIAPHDGVGFLNGHIEALGAPLGSDLSAAAARHADARRSR